MSIANKRAADHVESLRPFTGSHLFAVEENGFYVVYSYGRRWPLWANKDGVWYENDDKYSVSTSRHKSHTRPFGPTVKMSCIALRDMIAGVAVAA